MYEHRRMPPLSTHRFARRLGIHFGLSLLLVVLSLIGGMLGYEKLEALPWRDAFENAAMLLGGMGPVYAPVTNAGKLFAGFYALYSGLVFLVVAAVLLTPLVHRIMHKLHWEESETR